MPLIPTQYGYHSNNLAMLGYQHSGWGPSYAVAYATSRYAKVGERAHSSGILKHSSWIPSTQYQNIYTHIHERLAQPHSHLRVKL